MTDGQTDVAHPPTLTILTPTWNRAELLGRLYRSIQDTIPPSADVEWLIVDDGSTDDTADLVGGWQAAGPLSIRRCAVPHGGKHRALNAGFGQAGGDWILVVDSDDHFLPGAWQVITDTFAQADRAGAKTVIMPVTVTGAASQYRFTHSNRMVSMATRFRSEPPFDSSFAMHRSIAALRFPEFAGEAFMAEGAFFYAMPDDLGVWLGDTPCVAVEYQPTGLSHTILQQRVSSPRGAMLNAQISLRVAERRSVRLRALANFARFWWHAVLGGRPTLGPATAIQALMIPLGLPFALADRIKLVLKGPHIAPAVEEAG